MRGRLPIALAVAAGLAGCAETTRETGPAPAPPPLAALPARPRDPAAGQSWFQQGHALAAAGNPADAIAAFDKAVAADPLLGLAYLEAAEAHLFIDNDAPKLLALLERAVALLPDNPRAHLRLGDAVLTAGDEARAEKEWRAAIGIREDLTEAHVHLAGLLERQKKMDVARSELEKAIAAEPNNVQARVRLAELLESNHQPKEAAKQLEAAARSAQQSAELYRRAAKLYEEASESKSAGSMRAAADQIDPPAKGRKLRQLPISRVGGGAAAKKKPNSE